MSLLEDATKCQKRDFQIATACEAVPKETTKHEFSKGDSNRYFKLEQKENGEWKVYKVYESAKLAATGENVSSVTIINWSKRSGICRMNPNGNIWVREEREKPTSEGIEIFYSAEAKKNGYSVFITKDGFYRSKSLHKGYTQWRRTDHNSDYVRRTVASKRRHRHLAGFHHMQALAFKNEIQAEDAIVHEELKKCTYIDDVQLAIAHGKFDIDHMSKEGNFDRHHLSKLQILSKKGHATKTTALLIGKTRNSDFQIRLRPLGVENVPEEGWNVVECVRRVWGKQVCGPHASEAEMIQNKRLNKISTGISTKIRKKQMECFTYKPHGGKLKSHKFEVLPDPLAPSDDDIVVEGFDTCEFKIRKSRCIRVFSGSVNISKGFIKPKGFSRWGRGKLKYGRYYYGTSQVSRIVAEAYYPQEYWDGTQKHGAKWLCLHKNGTCTDNRGDNLEWGLQDKNMRDRYMHARERQTKRDQMTGASKVKK